jgi:ethanolaminephosphotransferase
MWLILKWNAFVELLPLWLAPNMVTLLGFVFVVVNVAFVELFMPDLVGPVGITQIFNVRPPD